jgi:hypothetical protein
MYKEMFTTASLAAAVSLAAACSGQTALTDETLEKAVREVGLPCGTVIRSEPIDEDNTSWRVSCDQAQTYVASVMPNGRLCIEPLYIGDGGPAPAGASFVFPEARCTS